MLTRAHSSASFLLKDSGRSEPYRTSTWHSRTAAGPRLVRPSIAQRYFRDDTLGLCFGAACGRGGSASL